jgi:hypothetical protein
MKPTKIRKQQILKQTWEHGSLRITPQIWDPIWRQICKQLPAQVLWQVRNQATLRAVQQIRAAMHEHITLIVGDKP